MKKALFTASSAANFLSLIALVAMTLITVVDVCGRRFFNSPLSGSVDLVRLCLAVAIFFALAYCESHQAHINVDILTRMFPKKAQNIVDAFMQFFSFVTVGIISWQMFVYAVKVNAGHQVMATLAIIISPFVFAAGVMTALFALLFLFRLVNSVRELKAK